MPSLRHIARSTLPTLKARIREAARFAWTVILEFQHDHGPLMASAMSFHATLSLFPLLLLGVSALGYVYGSEQALHEILALLAQYAPAPVVNTVRDALLTIVDTRAQVLAIGLVALVWTATTVFMNMEAAFSITWSVRPRPYWKSRLLSFAMLLLVGAVAAASIGFAAITLRVDGLQWYLFGRPLPEIPRAWHLFGVGVPFLLSAFTFSGLYYILPNTRVHFRAALLGGTVTALMWLAALNGFRVYLSGYARYDIVYGSLGGAVAVVLWIYYTMTALLLGAEIAWQADQQLRDRRGLPAETPEGKLSTPPGP